MLLDNGDVTNGGKESPRLSARSDLCGRASAALKIETVIILGGPATVELPVPCLISLEHRAGKIRGARASG